MSLHPIFYVYNVSCEDEVICCSRWSRTFLEKIMGLRFKKSMPKDEGLSFRFPSSSPITGKKRVGGGFMRFPLDLIFLDKKFVIVDLTSLFPNRGYSPRVDFEYVLELNWGMTLEKNLQLGDKLRYEAVL